MLPVTAVVGLVVVGALLVVTAAQSGSALVPAAGYSAPSWLFGPMHLLGNKAGNIDRSPLVFYIGLWIALLCYVLVLHGSDRLPQPLALRALAVLLVLFTVAPPLLSQDVFSYISYARLSVLHGLNPYTHAPAAFPSDAAFTYVGWRDAASAYGPLFTLLSYPLAYLGVAAALWSFKLLAAAAFVATLGFVRASARRLNLDPLRAVLVVGLNPLALVHVVGGAHNDALVALALTTALWSVLAGRSALSGSGALAAAFLKASATVAAPFLVLGSKERGKAALGILAAAAAVAALSLVVFGDSVLDSLGLIGENQARTSFYSLPNQTTRLLAAVFGGSPANLLPATRGVFLAAYAAFLALMAWRVHIDRSGWITAAGWGFVGLLCATSWLLPWYIMWLLPFAALSASRRLTMASLALTAYMLMIRVPL